jgi:hypothetical protein
MVVRLPATHCAQTKFLILISVKSGVNLIGLVWLEGLGKLKRFSDFIRTQPVTLQLVAPQPFTLPCASIQYRTICKTNSNIMVCCVTTLTPTN